MVLKPITTQFCPKMYCESMRPICKCIFEVSLSLLGCKIIWWVQEKNILSKINNCYQNKRLYHGVPKRIINLYMQSVLTNGSNESVSLMHFGPIHSWTTNHFNGFSSYTERKSYTPNPFWNIPKLPICEIFQNIRIWNP